MKTLSPAQFVGAASLSALAGFVDAIAFIYLGGFFVSFMSGNTTVGSVELAQGGDWAPAFLIVAAFVIGVIAGTVITRVASRPAPWVLAAVTLLLLVGTLLTGMGLPTVVPAVLIAAGMGAINTVFARDGGPALGLTYMTGALVKMAQELVSAFTGGSRTAWLRQLALWSAIAIGAIAGALAYGAIGITAMWSAVVGAVAAVVIAAIAARRA
ncbi:uncharacterized membrane protein YoaK (UPF0700 family) [Microbacteriaceae bacterium SG_E_30_P1]|uniref:Uncharacterized membrane protein YoaK (UPF0700 family) n=1 Tax=Antiquaquibacter oligotrophicus TaxID=2880260 RepID=A0ABT6KJV0_9MICO|nr:DUF1275 family protein [Antiquaquibacter oligotrophicus]MDH6180211.1 uncharacterized membrane protein YoaK (UPF0700 family) [Antiquaquibacter oligotrophicus]UDF14042.1 DUF1275 family protein [Antiquaquibacter oligotrophicus]